MKTNRVFRICIILLLVVINVGCDQVSKSIVRKNIDAYEHIKLIDNNFTLTKVENKGAFLSAGNNLPEPIRNVILSLIPALVLVGALGVALFNRTMKTTALIGLCFVIGGGIGNVFDRIMYGSVTDFLHIKLGWFQTGIFNMADVSIMVGFGILLLQYLPKTELKTQ